MGSDFHEWKKHFIDQARGLIPHEKKFYAVSQQRGKEDTRQVNINMVSPTEQVVERAKATLSHPPTTYDPISGVMQQGEVENTKIKRKRKTKRKRLIKGKKRKISKKKKKKKTIKKKNQ